jgi:hypothetical protein
MIHFESVKVKLATVRGKMIVNHNLNNAFLVLRVLTLGKTIPIIGHSQRN